MSPIRFPRRSREGVALVLVLSILVLLTALVVAFFIDTTTDLSASKNYSDAARAQQLAHAAVNVVEAQIRAGVSGGTTGAPLAWASQPGMIRTYDTSGKLANSYKLYSSDVMQSAGTSFSAPGSAADQSEDLPGNWSKLPSDFVDLNSPELISDANGTLKDPNDPTSSARYTARFPIIDGNNLVPLTGLGTSGSGTTITSASLPLLGYDLNGDGFPDVEGFSVQQPTNYSTSKPLSSTNNPVPMPVRWLYVLQDGELNPRDPKTGVIAGASSINPVVGRIAFWTDDDTCKLNVNTASEGTFWGRPWVKSPLDENLGSYFPAQNEFQMFPGHPAKTCLSTVFGSIWPVAAPANPPNTPCVNAGTSSPTYIYANWLPYYDLTPRVTQGQGLGSAGGTQATNSTAGIVYDTDPLFATLDEIMFKPPTSNSAPRPKRSDAGNTAGGAPLTPQFLETTRFFLTASNRAPEVTLFNTPRLSLWPIQADSGYRTAKDQLLAACSTIPASSTNVYYFQRATATKNAAGTTTLASGLSCESPTLDYVNPQVPAIARNQSIYSYLKQLLSSPVPGLGGTFQSKYPNNTGQIATEMLDQIRAGVNTVASNPLDGNSYSYTQPQYDSGMSQVVPLEITDAGTVNKGFGRFSTIAEAAIDFFQVSNPPTPTPLTPPPPPTVTPILPPTTADLGAFLILQPYNPSPGFPSWSPSMRVEVTGLDAFKVVGVDANGAALGSPVSLGFPATSTNIVDANAQTVEGNSSTPWSGLASMFFYNSLGTQKAKTIAANPGVGTSPSLSNSVYPFANTTGPATGCHIQIAPVYPPTVAKYNFIGGPVTIKIYSNPQPPGTPELVQTINLTFPNCPTSSGVSGLPIPAYNALSSKNGSGNLLTTVATIVQNRIGDKLPGSTGRSQNGGFNDGKGGVTDGQRADAVSNTVTAGSGLVDVNDVVRSMIVNYNGPSKGDYRVIAGLSTVPDGMNYYTTHPFWNYPLTAPGQTILDPGSNWAFNWRFAHDFHSGVSPGYGEIGWYDFVGSAKAQYTYLDSVDVYGNSAPFQGRKPAYCGTLLASASFPTAYIPAYAPPYFRDCVPAAALGLTAANLNGSTGAAAGDWDTGYGQLEDGAYVNKPDEGNGQTANQAGRSVNDYSTTAYFNRGFFVADPGKSYSPNRQISSAVAFGSLPTGINPTGTSINPWQTLLFCANPAAGLSHPGFGSGGGTSPSGYPLPPYTTIPDHYVLDLFTMPVVEPYAISEPLSTQGKVNMNYQIAPFTYVRRDTGVRAVMKSTWMCAIPQVAANRTSFGEPYKEEESELWCHTRYGINADETTGTLKGFEDRFNNGDIFRSASEICGLPLVPQQIAGINQALRAGFSSVVYPSPAPPTSPTYANMSTWWNSYSLTGDNLREEPYGDLYPRLTTKSNTFTVHVRVQALKKSSATGASTFVDPTDTNVTGGRDVITAEYRGSYQIERYVDPNVAAAADGTAFPDYASGTLSTAVPIDKFYKFRTINTKRF